MTLRIVFKGHMDSQEDVAHGVGSGLANPFGFVQEFTGRHSPPRYQTVCDSLDSFNSNLSYDTYWRLRRVAYRCRVSLIHTLRRYAPEA